MRLNYNCNIGVGTVLAFLSSFIGFIMLVMSLVSTESDTQTHEVSSITSASNDHIQEKIMNSGENFNCLITWPNVVDALPPNDYPHYDTLFNVVNSWNPDEADPPANFTEALQHFNFSDPYERKTAENFRNAEVPFKLYGIPDVEKVNRLWTDSYLTQHLATYYSHVEKSKNNHFMFWRENDKDVKNWRPPTEVVNGMQFTRWLALAKDADKEKLKNSSIHYYFQTNSLPGQSTFINKDLKIFSSRQANFFVTNVPMNKGIQCRFGMRGVIAESHFDGGRNMVAMLKGNKRYILSPPTACNKLGIISDVDHPSYRHSVIDWSDMSQARSRGFDAVPAIDTILRQGEILYIPSYWFHYIISLQYSIQCNSRSGSPPNGEGLQDIEKCLGRGSGKLFRKTTGRAGAS